MSLVHAVMEEEEGDVAEAVEEQRQQRRSFVLHTADGPPWDADRLVILYCGFMHDEFSSEGCEWMEGKGRLKRSANAHTCIELHRNNWGAVN
jgi:hypothetical protein